MLRMLLLICLVLLIPVIPFLLWGATIERWTAAWVAAPPARGAAALVIYGLLATDLLLPVPASVVSTFAGSLLGWGQATLVCFAGMSSGAVVGFALARQASPWIAARVERKGDYERLRAAADRLGGYLIVLLRAVPVLAEASVLLVGLQGMRWSRFLPALLLSNLGLAAGYALLGVVATRHDWLPLALALSAVVPLALAAWLRRR